MEEYLDWRTTTDSKLLRACDLAIGEENGKVIYKELNVIAKEVLIEQEIENHKTNEKQIKNILVFQGNLKPMVLNIGNQNQIEMITGTKNMHKWKNFNCCVWVERGVYKPGTKKADNITTDALRIKPVVKRLCEVCGKIISEEIYNASIKKYGKAFCSAECKEKGEK
jgi:septum formation inhibitor-activating ATPase MinD